MGLFDKFKTRESSLEGLITEIESNMANNYKDAAQSAFKELIERFDELMNAGKLNDKQKAFYSDIIERYKSKLQGYSHKDQKPYWSGQ